MSAPGNAIIGNTPNRSIIHNVAKSTLKPGVSLIVFTLAISRRVHVNDVKRVVSSILFISPGQRIDLENRLICEKNACNLSNRNGLVNSIKYIRYMIKDSAANTWSVTTTGHGRNRLEWNSYDFPHFGLKMLALSVILRSANCISKH